MSFSMRLRLAMRCLVLAIGLLVPVAPVTAQPDGPSARDALRLRFVRGRAVLRVPVPRESAWQWGRRNGNAVVDGTLEVFWPSGRTQEVLHMGRHVLPTNEGFGWHWMLDSASAPGAGGLAALLTAGRGVEYQHSWCGEFPCYSTYAEAAVQVLALGDSAIVLSLGSSSLLHRLRQLRPDTVRLRFYAPGDREIWRDEPVPVEYARPR